MKLNLRGRKLISVSKLVISKQSSKSKVKDKVFAAFLIEVSSDNETKKNDEKKKKNDENENEKEKNVEEINVSVIIKSLFDKKNCSIIDFKRHVNDVKKNYINVLNIQNFEKNANKIISTALKKKKMNEIFILIIKMYTFV